MCTLLFQNALSVQSRSSRDQQIILEQNNQEQQLYKIYEEDESQSQIIEFAAYGSLFVTQLQIELKYQVNATKQLLGKLEFLSKQVDRITYLSKELYVIQKITIQNTSNKKQ
ncbi:Hypothetical_protein [Hexamita inflata]|uniref:Hypothetical_protein n=1 Tax=Hexamita inflata TaxID=28002 RepID=A0AA86TAB7_9EUKA|nr:Hypothetical protein HINF_LOCUS316 [Hexamita inflata]